MGCEGPQVEHSSRCGCLRARPTDDAKRFVYRYKLLCCRHTYCGPLRVSDILLFDLARIAKTCQTTGHIRASLFVVFVTNSAIARRPGNQGE